MSSQDAGGTVTADRGKDTGERPPSAAFYEICFVSGVEIAPRGEKTQELCTDLLATPRGQVTLDLMMIKHILFRRAAKKTGRLKPLP